MAQRTDTFGRAVITVRSSEIGYYAQPEYKETLQSYLTNLETYQTLAITQIPKNNNPSEIADLLRAPLQDRLRRDPQNAAVVSGLQPDVIRAWIDHISLLIARCAGMSADEYLRGLGPDATCHIPINRELLKYTLQTFLSDRSIPADGLDTSALKQLFGDLYSISDRAGGDPNRVVGLAASEGDLRVAFGEMPAEVDFSAMLPKRFTEKEARLFVGSVSQGALVFWGSPDNRKAARMDEGGVLRAEVIIIVRTQGNDFYPIVFQSCYDPKRTRWWLLYANRQSSCRLALVPPLVF